MLEIEVMECKWKLIKEEDMEDGEIIGEIEILKEEKVGGERFKGVEIEI